MSALKEAMPSDDMMMVAGLGHNNPPEPTPFDLSEHEISELYGEAKHWLDGDPIETQEIADRVQSLMDKLRKAEKTAEARLKDEVEPFKTAEKAARARYAPLIADTQSVKGKTVLGIAACKEALKPFLLALDAEKKRIADAARAEADRLEAEARAAFNASRVDDLERREVAEALAQLARQAETVATRAANEKAHAKGSGRAATLRTSYRAEVTDMNAFARFVWQQHLDILDEFLRDFAQKKVTAGARDMPGVLVHEESTVV